ncbi:MAG: hypothetical protein ACK559_32710, partial [bacterium]
DYLTPREVRRIVRAAKRHPKGLLRDIHMLDEDIQLFLYSFPDANEEELREQCCNTVLEYEESMQVWEEIEYTKSWIPAAPTRKTKTS